MSELRVGATVRGRDGDLGKLDALVIDPTAQAVTHLVIVHEKLGPRLLVPESHVVRAHPGLVELDLDEAELHDCERFDEPNYNSPDASYKAGDLVLDPGSYFLEPFASPLDGWSLVSHERVPKGEVTQRRGAAVRTSDGTKVGHVDEFLVDPEDGHITHVVVREGHISRKDIVVPIGTATALEDENIELAISLTELEELEKIPVRRHHHIREDDE